MTAVERRAEELKGRAAVLAERRAALAEMERQRAGFSEGVGDLLKGAAGIAPRGVVGDRLDVPPGLEKAAEATLGDLLEAVVVGGMDEASRGVAYLRGNGRGRVSFVAERSASALEGAYGPPADGAAVLEPLSGSIGGAPYGPIARILSRTLLVDDLDQALHLHASQPAFAYVTRQGDLVDLDGTVTGGDGRALSHWLLQRRVEREEVGRRMSEAAAAREEAEGACLRLREELAEAQERLTSAATDVQEEARVAFERDLRLQQGREELGRIDRALPLLAGEQARLQRDIASSAGEMAA